MQGRPESRERRCLTAFHRAVSLTFVLVPFLSSTVVRAQTNDVYFRAWRWNDDGGVRASAVAGATVALTDDAAGLTANPSVLATLSRSELSVSVGTSRATRTVIGDALAARTSVDELSAAVKLGPHISVAVFRREPQSRRIELAPLAAVDGARDEGSLSAVITDVGVALARSFGQRLALGLAVTRCHMDFAAEYQRVTPPLPAVLEVGAAGGAQRLVPSLGMLLSLGRRAQLGLSHRVGVSWQILRVATSPLLALTLDAGTPMRIVRPAITSLGMRLSLSRKLALVSQIDYLQSATAAPGVLEGYRELSVPRRTWEPHAAMELALPARNVSLLLRSGIHWIPRPASVESLTSPAASPAGVWAWAPPPPAALFERAPEDTVLRRLDARWSFGAGLALVTRPGWRFDLALRADGERTALLAGTSWRF
jgi:hypothetical protein